MIYSNQSQPWLILYLRNSGLSFFFITLRVNQMKCVSLASLFQHVTMHTCLIRYVRHVGGIMFDCFFIMFQCCFKVLILIRSVPQFFFLQGLLGNKWGIRGLKKLNLTKWLRTHWKRNARWTDLSLVFWKVFLFGRRWLSLFGFGGRRGSGLLFFFHLGEVKSQQHRQCGHHSWVLQLPVKTDKQMHF